MIQAAKVVQIRLSESLPHHFYSFIIHKYAQLSRGTTPSPTRRVECIQLLLLISLHIPAHKRGVPRQLAAEAIMKKLYMK